MNAPKLAFIFMMSGLFIGGAPLLTACTSAPTHESAGQYLDNSAITAKVKAKLLADNDVKSFAISVESYKGRVQLSGFVNNAYQKQRAVDIARGVPGVVSVQDSLIIKHHIQ